MVPTLVKNSKLFEILVVNTDMVAKGNFKLNVQHNYSCTIWKILHCRAGTNATVTYFMLVSELKVVE